MAGNVTVTVTSTSTSTSAITLTGTTHTVTTQAPTFLLFGLPPELIALFTFAIVGIIYAFFRFQVKGVPVLLIWIYKNGAAIILKGKEDLQGIFLDVIRGNKKVELLKKTGLPLQVRYLPDKFKAYIDVPKDRTINEEKLKALRDDGFKMTVAKYDRKARIRGYIIEKEHLMEKTLAYLDVNLGGMKMARIYAAIEGSGETIDWAPKIAGSSEDTGNTVLLGEMKSAAKGFFQLLAEAMQGSLKTFLLPLLAGLGLGGMLVVLVFILSGHVK